MDFFVLKVYEIKLVVVNVDVFGVDVDVIDFRVNFSHETEVIEQERNIIPE
jgi:hypothetical protein